MVTTHRNMPCPCGSGRKYKHCCGTAAGPPSRELGDLKEAIDALVSFAEREEFRSGWMLAQAIFWGKWSELLEQDEIDELLDDPGIATSFYLGFAIDTKYDGTRSLLDMLVERHSTTMPSGVRRCLEKLSHTHVSLYRVELSVAQDGVDFVDLLQPTRWHITDPVLPNEVAGDLLAARLYPLADGTAALTGAPYDFPKDHEPTLREAMEENREVLENLQGPMGTPQFLKNMGLRFHSLWVDTRVDFGHDQLPEGPHGFFRILVFTQLVRALDECDLADITDDDLWTCPAGRIGNADPVTLAIDRGDLLVVGETDDDVEAVCARVEQLVSCAVERA